MMTTRFEAGAVPTGAAWGMAQVYQKISCTKT